VFVVDQASVISVQLISTRDGLTTRIVGPQGEVVDEQTISSFGGTFVRFEGTAEEQGPVILDTDSPGFHFVYTFPSLGPGTYTVHFAAPTTLAEEVAVITQVLLDSPVGAALFTGQPVLVLGNPVVLTAAIFEGSTPVAGANVAVIVQREDGTLTNLTLRDDGGAGDHAAGDGLYSVEYMPDAPGLYSIVAEMHGRTASGVPFVRQAATQVTVVPPSSQLTGTVQDQGVDDNANQLFDRVVLSVGLTVVQAGEYRIFVHLTSAREQSLVRSATANLAVGVHTIPVNFEAAALRELGENGPYDIALVEVLFLGEGGGSLSDRLVDLGQTHAYRLTDFERPAIVLTGQTSDTGIDTGDPGTLFDLLEVKIGVDLLMGGSYQWSARLVDVNNTELDTAGNTGTLGVGVNMIALTFDGRKIGRNGLDGPYVVTDLLMSGAGASLMANNVAITQAYRVTSFDGAPGNLDNDTDVDLDDLTILLVDRNKSVQGSACGAACDLDGDGKITALDARLLILRCTRPGCATQ
jgi:hypothetical protein